MLLIKFQSFLNKIIDYYSIHKVEKLIIKTLYKNNLGPNSDGLNDVQLRSLSNSSKYISSKSSIFRTAMQNLKFKKFIEYLDNYENIKITLDGMTYYSTNHIFIKQTFITATISGIFSVLLSVITNLILK